MQAQVRLVEQDQHGRVRLQQQRGKADEAQGAVGQRIGVEIRILGRYLYRGVILEQDIVACEKGRVSFRYRNAQTGKSERRTLSGVDFLWLILQHVLPKGFRRARNFGFLHANCKRLIALLHLLLKFDPSRFKPARKERPAMLCACCGAVMAIVRTRIRATSSAAVPDLPRVGVAI